MLVIVDSSCRCVDVTRTSTWWSCRQSRLCVNGVIDKSLSCFVYFIIIAYTPYRIVYLCIRASWHLNNICYNSANLLHIWHTRINLPHYTPCGKLLNLWSFLNFRVKFRGLTTMCLLSNDRSTTSLSANRFGQGIFYKCDVSQTPLRRTQCTACIMRRLRVFTILNAYQIARTF